MFVVIVMALLWITEANVWSNSRNDVRLDVDLEHGHRRHDVPDRAGSSRTVRSARNLQNVRRIQIGGKWFQPGGEVTPSD
uniref:Putative secreted peptide n=1 Tax=Anopheles braziliensis TaxID=58242 RepID=A0A2M3ZPV1_9DIPT